MRIIVVTVILLGIIMCMGCDVEKSSFMEKVEYEIYSGQVIYYTDNYTIDDGFIILKDWVVGGYPQVHHEVIRLGKGQIQYIRGYEW